MLNENIKKGFIEEYLRSKVVAPTTINAVFKKIVPFERKFKKDVSEFNEREVLDMYQVMEFKTVKTLQNYNNYLKAYTLYKNYCENKTENIFKHITKEMLQQCISDSVRKNKYLSYEQFQDIKRELLNYTDMAILECLWAGIAGKNLTDLTYLRQENVDVNSETITLKSGKIVKLYDELYELLEKAFQETEYVCYGTTIKVKPVVGIGTLYKTRDNAYRDSDDVRFRWIYRKIMTIREYLDIPELSMKTLHGAGMLHKIKKGMQESGLAIREFLQTDKGEKLFAVRMMKNFV